MSASDYLLILKKLLIKQRSVVKESYKYYKVYLPTEYNEVWNSVHEKRMKVDVIVFLPRKLDFIDRILMMNRLISKENERFKLYLDKRYNTIWKVLHENKEKIDLIIVLK